MKDGSVYTGSFVDGKEDGSGVVIDKKTETDSEGFFKMGKRHGAFIETNSAGNVIRKGVYKYGNIEVQKK